MTHPRYTPLAQSLPATVPFVGPEAQERARGQIFDARLGANENGFGPSPKAISAMQTAASEGWMYGDPESYDLRAALAAHLEIQMENIVVGEGIDGLLGYLVRLLIGPGDAVVTSEGAYPTFNYHVAGFGGVLHKVPYKDDHEDPEALLAKAREVDAKLIYLANPDNPMGTWQKGAVLQEMAEQLPEGCLLVLDEAYVEFAPKEAVPSIAVDHPGVLRLRTFSKAYGLAGLRVGYAFGAEDLIRSFDKIRNHFGMSRVGQAGALAALEDTAWLNRTQDAVARARQNLSKIAQEQGLTALPSATNFVAIDCGADGAFARSILADIIASNVFIRMPFVAPQDRCLRVSCAQDAALAHFAQALETAMKRAPMQKI